MRNLKRALSLALASVMVLGLMVVGTGASYKDVSSENHKEAIEVLQKIGVMVGDDNGNFNPDNTVTRNEMAVVVSNLMDYRVASYKGTSPFTDVPSWAEPYVAACWTNGNIVGYTATTFGGSDPVTTSQAALMLMKALGYFQYQSDFGDDWQLATVSQGNKIDLFTDVDSGVREPMTRNDLAQLVLNTLKSGTVEADDDTIKVDAGDVKVEAGKVKYNYITSGESYSGAIKGLTTAGTIVNSGTRIVELGEKLYKGDLKMYENETDDFGRPGTRWAYKVEDIGTYADAPVGSYTAKASLGTLYSLLGSTSVGKLSLKADSSNTANGAALAVGDANKLVVYVDGAIQGVSGKTVSSYFDRNSSSGGNSGKGVLTEVYQDDDNNVTLVFVNTYLMQATNDYSEKKKSVAVTVLTGAATDNALNDDDFDGLSAVAEDDYILYTYAKGQVQDVAVAEVVEGQVTAYSNKTGKAFGDASGSVTLDGTQYDYAKFAEVDADNGCAVEYVVSDTATIVTDAYGYAIYVDDASVSVGNYVYVAATAPQTNLSTKIIADAYFADGTNDTIVLKAMKANNGATITPNPDNRDYDNKGWYSYSKNSKGEYTLKKAANQGQIGTSINQNTVTIVAGVAGNANTVFVVKDKDDKIAVYTGISNVPDITGITNTNSYYLRENDAPNKAAAVVFVDATAGTVKNTTDSLLYTLKLDSTTVDNTDNEKVYTWKVLLDGEETTLKTKESWTAKKLYEDYNTDSDGYYETGSEFDDPDDSDKFTDTLTGFAAGNRIDQSGSTLTIGSRSVVVNNDTQISLVMYPDTKGAGNTLSGTIMADNNADYELALNTSAKNLSNTFKNYKVNGAAYFVYDDASKSDLVTHVYVVVTDASGAGTPNITAQPAATTTVTAGSITGTDTLSITVATPADGGTLSYQWKQGTERGN